MREEGRIGRHPEARDLRGPDRRHRLVEHALAFDRGVVALAQAVHVNRPGEVWARLELVQLLLQQQRVRAQVHELLACHQLRGDEVDLGMDERLAARDRDHRRARLLDRVERLLDRHPLLQDVLRVLDLPAERAGEVALEERLELDEQRELLHAPQLLLGQVAGDPERLAKRDRQLPGLLRRVEMGTTGKTKGGHYSPLARHPPMWDISTLARCGVASLRSSE